MMEAEQRPHKLFQPQEILIYEPIPSLAQGLDFYVGILRQQEQVSAIQIANQFQSPITQLSMLFGLHLFNTTETLQHPRGL